jgi:alpha-amylase
MASVCFYFQLHQPMRLRRYSVFDTDSNYFDNYRNAELLRKIADRCYLPVTEMLGELVAKLDGRFRFSLSVTGLLIDQMRDSCPELIDRLAALAESGCVEFCNETYHHSLAFLYSREEFAAQVDLHAAAIKELFGQTPKVFRNTELIYNNDLAHYIDSMGRFDGVLSEGADQALEGRSPTVVYTPPHTQRLKLLLKHYRMSDDIAFRFSNRDWPEWPLTAEKYAEWVARIRGTGDVCNLFMDIETFGEHQWAETGILEFLQALPAAILKHEDMDFATLSEAMDKYKARDTFDVPHMISWADSERDLSAWLGNAMQSNALHELYKLEGPIKALGDEQLLQDWRRLTASDHFYYMCTKYYADGEVHKYFNPYESPYDGYINFMNVLDNLRTRASEK